MCQGRAQREREEEEKTHTCDTGRTVNGRRTTTRRRQRRWCQGDGWMQDMDGESDSSEA